MTLFPYSVLLMPWHVTCVFSTHVPATCWQDYSVILYYSLAIKQSKEVIVYKSDCWLITEKSDLKEALPSHQGFLSETGTRPTPSWIPTHSRKVLPVCSLPLRVMVQTTLCCLSLKLNCLCSPVTILRKYFQVLNIVDPRMLNALRWSCFLGI